MIHKILTCRSRPDSNVMGNLEGNMKLLRGKTLRKMILYSVIYIVFLRAILFLMHRTFWKKIMKTKIHI